MADGLKLIFAGTPEFAATHLQALLNSEHRVIAVYSQPDRPSGRGRKLKVSPVKQLALENAIPVYQPNSLKDQTEQQNLADLNADLMIVVAYGLILPPEVLSAPRYGCVNVHASLLPRWRGAAPIQRAIFEGDSETGVTIMQMDKGLDTGDMLLTVKTEIKPDDTSQTLHDRLATIGAEALLDVLSLLGDNKLTPQKQDDSQANYAEKIHKQEAQIDWGQPAQRIHQKVCAFNPWPVAESNIDGERLRIWESCVIDDNSAVPPGSTAGSVIHESRDGIDVSTGKGLLRIKRLQLPGGKPLNAAEFLNAHSLKGKAFNGV